MPGAAAPAMQPHGSVQHTTANHYLAQAANEERQRRAKAAQSSERGAFATEASVLNGGVMGGSLAMLIAVVWFVGGLSIGLLFYYPPILFVLGLVGFVKGLIDS